ncbi:signal peptidase I [Candidatus Woesearchaeota archaeon]|nr:signal peptidase I [Candidatus Woesearchaeota archaeon]
MKGKKLTWKKLWHFIWEDNSLWSWIVNIALAFVLIKFIVYPGLGFLLSTSHPVVAVVSESMEHNSEFEDWWQKSGDWYVNNSIDKEDFGRFPLKNGFDKGDIMVLKGKKPENIEIGDIIVFWSAKRDPIIHRVVKKWQDKNNYYFQTKGDNYKTNPMPIKSPFLDETSVSEELVVGNAIVRIPLLGYVKIWAVELFNLSKDILSQKG